MGTASFSATIIAHRCYQGSGEVWSLGFAPGYPKRPFTEAMVELRARCPDEVDQLSVEEIAERTGYSVSTVRSHLKQDQLHRIEQEKEQRRMQEINAYTYITPSGNTQVVYYPIIGEVRISNTREWKNHHPSREITESGLLLSPEDAFAVGIYLLGLQPHIRDVLARKDNAAVQEPHSTEYSTSDMAEQDL